MDYYERILQVSKYKGFSSINKFAKNALNYGSSEKINRLKDGSKKPSIDIIVDITNKFEDISIEWLLIGKGSMLKSVVKKGVLTDFSYSEIAAYIFDHKEMFLKDPVYSLLIENETKDRVIKKLQEEKEHLLKKRNELR